VTEPATNVHYSQEVAFFGAFLDPYMKYSSALFASPEEPLAVGIVRMLDHLIDAAKLRPGARVLDLGNGWGCLLKRMRERGLEVDYTGLNPSEVQLDHVRRAVDPDARLLHGTFEQVRPRLEGRYDAIFLIGSLCHLEDKQQALRDVAALLADGGRVVLEDTWFLSEALYQAHRSRPETKFVQDTVFGFAHVTSLAWHYDAVRAAGLWVRSSLDNSFDYLRTTDAWCDVLATLDADRFPLARQAVAYMDVFRRGWGHTICNQVMVLERLPPRQSARFSAR
jgi:cyclopropane-fatty-acyl-phospholipid synthase